MGQESVEGRDYDRVIAKLPRYDKEGRDVTGDKMGTGGRRKDDGRQSVQAYDFGSDYTLKLRSGNVFFGKNECKMELRHFLCFLR